MPVNEVDLVVLAAELHDVGKVAIPDLVLGKPGPLDEDEWRLMGARDRRRAPALGGASARGGGADRPLDPRAPGTASVPGRARRRGDPLAARVVAACDAFERCSPLVPTALDCRSTTRFASFARTTSSQFDPAVVDVLVESGHVERRRGARTPARSVPVEPRLSTIREPPRVLDVTRLVRRAGSLSVSSTQLRAPSPTHSASTRWSSTSAGPGTDVFEVVTVHGSDASTRRAPRNGERLGRMGSDPQRSLPSPRRIPHSGRRV